MLPLFLSIPTPTVWFLPSPAPAASVALVSQEPRLALNALQITTKRFTRYNPPGRKEPVYGQWSWVPRIQFGVTGPLEGGSQLVVNVTKPDGSAWLSLPCETPELAEGAWSMVEAPELEEQKAIPVAGVCGIQIVLKNALTGTKKMLFTGKFTVKSFKDPYDKAPGATEFYVDHDWLLPMGYMGLNLEFDQEAPPPVFRLWLRGSASEARNGHIAAYIFYKGKQLASSKHVGAGGSADELYLSPESELVTPGNNKNDPTWYQLKLTAVKLRAYRDQSKLSANNYSTQHFLATNPGEYELKLTRDGKPIRSAKFTVDEKGLIVNDGIGAKLGTVLYFLPIRIEPGTEPTANLAAYKTGAFYGNPIPGFIAP